MENSILNRIGLIILVVAIVLSATFTIIQNQKRIVANQKMLREVKEAKLVKWVYDHSTLISRSDCGKIVKAVMKTKHPTLVLAIIELESKKFTPGAISEADCMGWTQVNHKVHGKELIKVGIIREIRDLWDIEPNVLAGAFILEQKMKNSNGDVRKSLDGYLGKKDGAYVLRILSTHADLVVLTGE